MPRLSLSVRLQACARDAEKGDNAVGLLSSLQGDGSKDLIEARKLGFTTAAGFASLIVVIVGGVIPALDPIFEKDISDPLKIAVIGLVGVGIIGWAIAGTGDVLARAYASAHIVRFEGKPNQPALQTAANELQEAIDKLASAYSDAHPSSAKKTPAQLIALPTPLDVEVRGTASKAVAALVEEDETVKYLVGRPGEELAWVSGSAVYLTA